MFWADFKVGLRMLVKHPVLTIIGAVATTFAIGAGGAYFEIVNDYSRPSLPLQDGARVVTIRNDDLAAADTEDRALHDFTTWRNELKTVEDLGVYTLYRATSASRVAPACPLKWSRSARRRFASPGFRRCWDDPLSRRTNKRERLRLR